MRAVSFTLNDRERTFRADPDTPLLYILRNDAGLNAAKYGCGLAQCGACNVLLDGTAVPSCRTPMSAAEGRAITTVEGLGTADDPHPIQQAFMDEQAAQCGYCIAGMIVTAKALLDRNPDPADGEIREALAGNLCRCGTHTRILAAVKTAAKEMRG
jgi:nicotinate dehydrogenase subunit A